MGNYACKTCHNSELAWAIPAHGSPNELNVHSYDLLQADCRKCHSSYLTREHNVYVEGQGIVYGCNTCHKSTNGTVLQAISSHNRACSACHGSLGDHETVHLSSVDKACQAGAKMLISNRMNVAGSSVWGFYEQEMASGGWTLVSVDPSTPQDYFVASFTKGTRKVYIWFYGGENHAASPVLSKGYRLEILYW